MQMVKLIVKLVVVKMEEVVILAIITVSPPKINIKVKELSKVF